MTPRLELRGLVAGYGRSPVVHGLDLRVEPGEVVALLGPNGAGKTTTLLTVSGLLPPLGGAIELDGVPARAGRRLRATALRRARGGLAHVPEDRSLFGDLTTAEHLALAVPRRQVEAATARAVELFPALAAVLDRPAGVLSGGEQQMLAMARGLVTRPRVLLVDELSLGLAPRLTRHLLAVVRGIADDDGVAVLVVEQHVADVLAVADRGVVLSRGVAVASGTAAELAGDAAALATGYLGRAPEA